MPPRLSKPPEKSDTTLSFPFLKRYDLACLPSIKWNVYISPVSIPSVTHSTTCQNEEI